jgi:hypothetical protein
MKITQFDKEACRTLGTAVEQSLQKVAEEFGVSIKRKGGSYSSTNYVIKLEASVIGKGGVVLSREAEDFKNYYKMYNLELSDLGKTFTSEDGVQYKIKGLSTRSGKYPILAENLSNGKTFKLPERMVQRGLGRKVKPVEKLWESRSSIPTH